MATLDRLREQVGYLKFWQGIVVLTDISLVGWLISAVDEIDRLRLTLALLGIFLLTSGAIALHGRVAAHIEQIGKA
jgi:hypothetical protein